MYPKSLSLKFSAINLPQLPIIRVKGKKLCTRKYNLTIQSHYQVLLVLSIGNSHQFINLGCEPNNFATTLVLTILQIKWINLTLNECNNLTSTIEIIQAGRKLLLSIQRLKFWIIGRNKVKNKKCAHLTVDNHCIGHLTSTTVPLQRVISFHDGPQLLASCYGGQLTTTEVYDSQRATIVITGKKQETSYFPPISQDGLEILITQIYPIVENVIIGVLQIHFSF